MNADHAIAALRALSQLYRLVAFRILVIVGAYGLSVGGLRAQLQIPPAARVPTSTHCAQPILSTISAKAG